MLVDNSKLQSSQRIVIANAKGGCGKTTIATNLAALFVNHDISTMLLDYDAQCSSMLWLKHRKDSCAKIHGVAAAKTSANMTRSFQLRSATDVEKTIIDTPAGLSGFELTDVIRKADTILVPILPSIIDMDAASMFIDHIMEVKRTFNRKVKIAVVANRIKPNTIMHASLRKFLDNIDVPCIGSLRETMNYAKAAQSGLGVCELDSSSIKKDIDQWKPILDWLTVDREADLPAEARVVSCA